MRRITKPLLAAVLVSTLPLARAQWTAYNDHAAGPGTHPNATTWNVFGTRDGAPGNSGPLKDIDLGVNVPANLFIVGGAGQGIFASPLAANPAPGTPAYNVFNGRVDFAGAPNPTVEIASGTVSYNFTQLNPQRLYRFRGSAVHGDDISTNRWTLVVLNSTLGYTTAHSSNVLTSNHLATLQPNQALVNFNGNHTPATGDFVGWNGIRPSASGTFSVVCQRYAGMLPDGSSNGTPAFALTGIHLEEIVAPARVHTALIPPNHVWRYNQAGVDLGTEWRTTNYNDAAWSTGPGALGYEEAAGLPPGITIGTTLSRFRPGSSTEQVITYYFRSRFTVFNDPSEITLTVSNAIDDGAIFYVNGREVERIALSSGPVNYNTLANRTDDAGTRALEVFTIPPEYIRRGENVFAVEVHQGSATSSDLVFSSQVWLTIPEATPLEIVQQPESLVIEETKTAVFSVGASGNRATYQWYKDGALIPGATSSTLSIPNVSTNNEGSYRVVVENFYSSLQSDSATLTVVGDTNAPTLVEADATLNPAMTNVVVSFSELVSLTTATNRTNYRITNTVSGAALTINNATLVDGTNVILHTSPLAAGQNHILVVSNIRDVSTRANLILPNSSYPVRQRVDLIGLNNAYRFNDPYDNSEANLGTAWKEPGYNDNILGWGDGASIFFNGPDESVVPGGVGTHLSQTEASISYFRTPFTLQASPSGLRLLLRHLVDDGAVFYVNGKEAYRYNMPSGTITHETVSASIVGSLSITDFISLPIDAVNFGANLFAVSLHQSGPINSDKIFGAELTASVQSFGVGPVYIFAGVQDRIVAEGEPVTFDVVEVGGRRFQWRQVVNNVTNIIAGATNATYTIAAATTNMTGWRFGISVSNAVMTSGAISTNGTLRVLPDTNAPTIVSGQFGSNNTIVVSFSELLAAASANNRLNYTVTNAAGGQATVSAATLVNGTNVVLSFASLPAAKYTVVVRNVTDASSGANPIAANSAIVIGAQINIGITDAWKYNNNVDGGCLTTPAWTLSSFNDASWPGPSNALLYVEGSALPAAKSTLLSLFGADGETRIRTYYFRKAFTSPVAGTATLRLRHVIDDGVILYLNGVEIYRLNMGTGSVACTNESPVNVGDASLLGPFEIVVTNLAANNVIAAEVHQNGATSSDVVFGAELQFSVPGEILNPPLPVRITSQPQSRTNTAGTIASFSVTASGTQPLFYQWRKDGAPITGATNDTYAIENVQGSHAGTYSVVVTNVVNSVTSSNAVLTVTGGGCTPIAWTSPVLNHQRSGTNIILSWRNPVTNSCGSSAVFVLQQATSISNPVTSMNWSNVGTTTNVTISPTGSSRFFRLRLQ